MILIMTEMAMLDNDADEDDARVDDDVDDVDYDHQHCLHHVDDHNGDDDVYLHCLDLKLGKDLLCAPKYFIINTTIITFVTIAINTTSINIISTIIICSIPQLTIGPPSSTRFCFEKFTHNAKPL